MKTKKLLSILLAVMMMLSVVPIYASAATITLNTTNVIILEAPKISYGDQIDVNVITANYGVTANDLTVTGGKLGYIASEGAEPVVIPGTFSGSSTLKFSVGENSAIRLKFTPDDTATYSSPQISTSYTMAEGVVWPSANVIGQAVTVAEYPTAATITTGDTITKAKLSGGIVNDAEGNPVTGTWSYVNTGTYPTASGKYDIQFKATGYETIKTTVDITVTSSGTATLSETPTAQYYLDVGSTLTSARLIGGKVVDENGNEIISGKWSFVNDENIQLAKDIVLETEGTFTYKAVWLSAGLPPVFADVSVTVFGGYTVDKPTLATPVPWETGLTYGTLPFVYGNSSVPGTYTMSNSDTTISSNPNVSNSVTLTFTPDDTTLAPESWIYSFKVKDNDVWYTISEEIPTIVLAYGHSGTSASKGSAVSWPDYFVEQGVFTYNWSKDKYDISSLEVGDVLLVTGNVSNGKGTGYALVPNVQVYIQIASTTIEGDFGRFHSKIVDANTGEIIYKFACNCPGITGTVTIKQGDDVIATYTPDSKGYISETFRYTPKESGTYTFTATYTPGENDKVTIANPVVTSEAIESVVKSLHNIKVTFGDKVIERALYTGQTFQELYYTLGTDKDFEDFSQWVFKDAQGNEFVPLDSEGNPIDPASHSIIFVVPDHDVIITAKSVDGDDIVSDDNIGIMGWLQKIIDWFMNIIKQMMSLVGLGA